MFHASDQMQTGNPVLSFLQLQSLPELSPEYTDQIEFLKSFFDYR